MATKWFFVLVCLFALAVCSLGAPLRRLHRKRGKPEEDEKAKKYLKKYHYLNENNENDRAATTLALAQMQQMAGIPVTGIVDDATLDAMTWERCGVPDHGGILGEFTTGPKWQTTDITYKFVSFTQDLPESDQKVIFKEALKAWSDVSSLKFTEQHGAAGNDAIIQISYGTYDHGDDHPFDGPGRVLAHAYYPSSNPIGGDAHFDDSEDYTQNTYSGINLFQVAAHEFGHSLGLGHSSVEDALMGPYFRGYVPNFQLHSDDIAGIRSLYPPDTSGTSTPTPTSSSSSPNTSSSPTTTSWSSSSAPTPPWSSSSSPTTSWGSSSSSPSTTWSSSDSSTTGSYTTPTTPSPDEDITCEDPYWDAITRTDDGTFFVFRGRQYAIIENKGIADGYPRPISDGWSDLNDDGRSLYRDIDDAVYLPNNGSTYFFKGQELWEFDNMDPVKVGDARSYIAGWPGSPDAVFVAYNRIYLTIGDQYYRVSSNMRRIDPNYPRPLSAWFRDGQQVPDKLTSAIVWKNNQLYFFADTIYYKYNQNNHKTDRTYPRSVAEYWLGCDDDRHGQGSD